MSKPIVIDHGWNRILQEIAKAKTAYVKVGVLEGEKREEGTDQVTVAAVNEFGAPGANIPERSFMRSTADEQRSATERIKAAELDKIWAGRSDVSTSLKRLGEFMQAKIQRKIASGVPPVNAPATLLRKRRKGKWNRGKATFAGTIKTLIDTGALRQAIRYEVVD